MINAINRNESFDQFTIEQLDGDLLPNHTLDQEVASGFNRCNITSNEAGSIDARNIMRFSMHTSDRTEATSQVWLGLTTGCAVCHDHKFDPISQKEFYSLSAFFNNTTQKAMDGNVQNTPPTVVVPPSKDVARWTALPADIKAAQQKIDHRRESGQQDFATWLSASSPETFTEKIPKDIPVFHAMLDDNKPRTVNVSLRGTNREIRRPRHQRRLAGWRPGRQGFHHQRSDHAGDFRCGRF